MAQSVAWAVRVLARLPATPDIVWWTHRRDLGLLRLDRMLAKADGLIDQGATSEASGLLDTIAPEVERHLADHKQWLPELRERIARRRAKLG